MTQLENDLYQIKLKMDQSKERSEKYKSYKLFVDKILKNVFST